MSAEQAPAPWLRRGACDTQIPLALLFCFLVLLFFAPGRDASAQTGQITGVVTDSIGAAIPNATIETTDQRTGTLVRQAQSGADGTFRALNMPPATYSIKISAIGMQNLQRNNIALDEQQTLSLGNLGLTVGGSNDTVTVTEEAQLIETATLTTRPLWTSGRGWNSHSTDAISSRC